MNGSLASSFAITTGGAAVRSFDISKCRVATAEEQAQWKEHETRMAAEEAKANDPARRAASDAVKAHTVIRQNGRIVAAIYRDGQAMVNGEAANIGQKLMEQANRLPDAQRRDFIVNAIMKKLGGGAVEERYGETGWAPARGGIEREVADANLKSWSGR